MPTFKVEWLDREFPIRKVPISVNMSGWSNSGIIWHPQRVLLQTSCNVWHWILLVNGFPWVSSTSRIRWVEGEISEKPDRALYWPGYLCNFHNDLEWKSLFSFCEWGNPLLWNWSPILRFEEGFPQTALEFFLYLADRRMCIRYDTKEWQDTNWLKALKLSPA